MRKILLVLVLLLAVANLPCQLLFIFYMKSIILYGVAGVNITAAILILSVLMMNTYVCYVALEES